MCLPWSISRYHIINISIGIAAFNINEFGIKTGRADNQPCVWGKGLARKVYIAGYARPVTFLYQGLIIVINIKYIERRRVNIFQIKTSDIGNLSEISGSIGLVLIKLRCFCGACRPELRLLFLRFRYEFQAHSS